MISIVFQIVLTQALYKYKISEIVESDESTFEIVMVKVFMMYLYAARANMNLRSAYFMQKHKFEHKIRSI